MRATLRIGNRKVGTRTLHLDAPSGNVFIIQSVMRAALEKSGEPQEVIATWDAASTEAMKKGREALIALVDDWQEKHFEVKRTVTDEEKRARRKARREARKARRGK